FDDDTADIILRSSNSIDLHVFSATLTKASVIFRYMLSLPPPISSKKGLPVVQKAEDKRTLSALLRFCYPVKNPDIDSVDMFVRIYDAAEKFDIEFVKDTLLSNLSKI
ncbi:hypothetical protein BV25DRAFT_1776570, partial [Artomyces pyxidatus]